MMEETVNHASAPATADSEAIAYFKEAVASGKHWYIALLGAMGLWTSTEEVVNGRTYRYLIDGEAFDWLLLAERLCQIAGELVPEDEKNNLLFHGIPPVRLESAEVKSLLGGKKYRQYLNYFYGVTVEEALLLAVQEEVEKERLAGGIRTRRDAADEAFARIYGTSRQVLFPRFPQEEGYPHPAMTPLDELKEFTYRPFKYRLRHCEKARIQKMHAGVLRAAHIGIHRHC
ncbi:MAG: hypothetical protein N2506_08255, partial [Dehalococcoidales bacterium]|nr:hypothetical protein [Dehalococcoidales bacterium]